MRTILQEYELRITGQVYKNFIIAVDRFSQKALLFGTEANAAKRTYKYKGVTQEKLPKEIMPVTKI
ncbi:MAG TPA: hypothetical protein VF610_01015 [Segetibacter sp.]